MTSIQSLFYSVIMITLIASCSKGPKVIEAEPKSQGSEQSSGVFSPSETASPARGPASPEGLGEFHRVVAREILPTARYVYVQVEEGEQAYWIATRKQEVTRGGVYFYSDGLLKTNFHSKEYNRVFDRLYLVSRLVPEDHGGATSTAPELMTVTGQPTPSGAQKTGQRPDATPIASLVKNPEAYAGKEVLVSGTCVKVNSNIMERNWIHIQDGTADDFDLVITSDQFVHEGAEVSMRATVRQNVDFGAGYRYDLILENGVIVP